MLCNIQQKGGNDMKSNKTADRVILMVGILILLILSVLIVCLLLRSHFSGMFMASDSAFFKENWDLVLPENLRPVYHTSTKIGFHGDGTRYSVYEYNGPLNCDNDFSKERNAAFEQEVDAAVDSLSVNLTHQLHWNKAYSWCKVFRPANKNLYIIKQDGYLFLIQYVP